MCLAFQLANHLRCLSTGKFPTGGDHDRQPHSLDLDQERSIRLLTLWKPSRGRWSHPKDYANQDSNSKKPQQ
jgi:hypothetical protein